MLWIAVRFLEALGESVNRSGEPIDCTDQLLDCAIGRLLSINKCPAHDDQALNSGALFLQLCLMQSLGFHQRLDGVLDPG